MRNEGVSYYFREVEAQEWKLKHYLNHRLEREDVLPSWTKVYKDWQESIENIKRNNYKNVPGSICSFCKDLLDVNSFEVHKQETTISSFQNMSNLLRSTNTLGKRENASDAEEERSPKFSESNQHSIFYGGLPNYEEGIKIDPELVLKETNETMIPYFERSFNYDSWNCWTLKSGSVVTDLLEKASNVKGHPLRPEVWRIIRCGFKIAKPKWLSNEEYTEIQSFTKRPSITSPPKDIIELLKIKSLKSLGLEIKKFKRDKLNAHLLEDITSQNSGEEDLILKNIKITCLILNPEDPFTAFFAKVLSLFHKYVFIEDSVMQQLDVSEADYGGYLIHPCLKKILVGLEDRLYYHMGEVILSSVKSCRSRRKCTSSYEQKSDGVFTVKLRKSLMEVGHLEMSGGYGHKDIPRSTWDGCCKLPIGNSYMLEEIEDRIELWQMYIPSCGVLQYERSHKSIVPICYEEHRKHIFDFVVLLWDLKCGLLETSNTIFQLRDEHNDNLFESSKLSGSLPAYPFTPNKDRHKIGIKDANEDSDLDNSPIRSGRNYKILLI
ncbi:6383_t:CDS:2 [Funneliformis geosporum]|nr:6383_t:CDS:2 [Funneliformis geosporum]